MEIAFPQMGMKHRKSTTHRSVIEAETEKKDRPWQRGSISSVVATPPMVASDHPKLWVVDRASTPLISLKPRSNAPEISLEPSKFCKKFTRI